MFWEGGNLRIDAYAGAGKTTTLGLLAARKQGRGLYLAFNRAIAVDAQRRFPSFVKCATSHSIAFRRVLEKFGYPEWKLTGTLTPNLILDAFRLPNSISFRCGVVLERASYASILLQGVRHFLFSSDAKPTAAHVPRVGVLETLVEKEFEDFARQVSEHIGYLWSAMLDRTRGLPLGHDGYLKLWALSEPKLNADYILVDEAQDLNPVLFNVLNHTDCQLVYVGDPYQQIYEWRGAANAMEQVHTRNRTLLSQSFRFGPEIAAAANIILGRLGAKEPLRGLPSIDSQIGRVRPDAILSRTNTGVIENLLRCLSQGLRCTVVGGTKELERLLYDVRRIKQGGSAQSVELIGFQSWKDVMSFSTKPEGDILRGLVNLVQKHGEERILQGIGACQPDESSAQVVCSTAHRSKGREWNYVHLDSDFEEGFIRAAKLVGSKSEVGTASETRLLYVALTRARLGIHLPRAIASRFGIRRTSDRIIGESPK